MEKKMFNNESGKEITERYKYIFHNILNIICYIN